MRSGVYIMSVLAALAPSAASATDWYTGAPQAQQSASPTSFISFFDPNPPPMYGIAPVSAPATTPVVVRKGEPYVAPAPKSSFGVAIDTAITADTLGSTFVTAIGTIAPFSGFDESGLRLRISGVAGRYSYTGGGAVGYVQGTQTDASVMVGYEMVTPRASVAFYAGLDFNNNQTDKYDPNNASVGQATGAKVALDFNYRPTNYTMFSGVASYSTAHSAYYVRLKGGYAIWPTVYIGPEALFMGDNFFSQWRLGGHITGATFGMLQLGASAGVLVDKVRGTGAYGILDARVGF
jgi:hypothetical protein